MVALILLVETLEEMVVVGQLFDVHPAAYFAPEVKQGELLLRAHRPPTEAVIPAYRLVDERGEYIKEIIICDRKAAVQLVDFEKSAPSPLAFVARFQQFANPVDPYHRSASARGSETLPCDPEGPKCAERKTCGRGQTPTRGSYQRGNHSRSKEKRSADDPSQDRAF